MQLSYYIGCFSDTFFKFSNVINKFIYCWAQVTEFINYFESLTIDSDVGSWSICCKYNSLLNTNQQTEQVARSNKCITHLFKLGFSLNTKCCIICKHQLLDKNCVGFSVNLQMSEIEEFPLNMCTMLCCPVKGRSDRLKLRYISQGKSVL